MQNAEFRTLDSMGVSEVLLPSQYFDAIRGGAMCSEQRLILAVLVDAINVLQDRDPMAGARKRHAFAEAAKWVATKGNRYLFSFDSVCDALNIEPETLRERIGLAHGSTDLEWPRHLRLHGLSRTQRMRADRVREKRSSPFRSGGSPIETANKSQDDLCVR
jgi:hypothetical protein